MRLSRALSASVVVHAAAAVSAAAAPHLFRSALAAVLANHLVLAGASLLPRSRLLGPNLRRLGAAARRRGEVALTFDDGPDPEVTPQVLAQLAAAGAEATFFCVGRRAAEHPELVAAAVEAGHEVGNHTHSHRWSFALGGPRSMGNEIDRAQASIQGSGAPRPRFFRTPAGFQSPLLEPLLAERELRLTSWSRRGYDGVDGDDDRVARRLTDGLEAGDILLLHDRRRSDERGPAVLTVLPRLLDALAERGLHSVALGVRREDGPS